MNGIENYRDKVYGCWLGKSIGGTIGGPLEGKRTFLDLPFEYPKVNIENDDLDLQLVWLHVMEQKGIEITAGDLAEGWLNNVTYPFDEYGAGIANLRQGLKPPVSGFYNNAFCNCMGSPIRSEIWGCLFAGRPDVAGWYAYQDAQVDHWDEGVYGEILFACMESAAFVVSDIEVLIKTGCAYLPERSLVRQASEMAVHLHAEGATLREARDSILNRYQNSNFTHCVQNIAFTVLGLLYGEGHLLKSIIRASCCGYDVDCTAATAGAIIGILIGAEQIIAEADVILDERIVAGDGIHDCNAPATVRELTERTLVLAKTGEGKTLPTIGKAFRLPPMPLFTPPMEIPFHIEPVGSVEQGGEDVVFQSAYPQLQQYFDKYQCEELTLTTWVCLHRDQSIRFLPVCEVPMTCRIDDTVICSQEAALPFLPAPHRSSVRVELAQYKAGWHKVRIQLARAIEPPIRFAWIAADETHHWIVDLAYDLSPDEACGQS